MPNKVTLEFIFFILLMMVIVFEYECIVYQKTKNIALIEQVKEMEDEARLASLHFAELNDRAQADMNKAQQDSNVVMLDNVPEECLDAIEWGIEQSQRFKA